MTKRQPAANRYDLVLLGALAEKPASGYDILMLIRDRGMDRWARISTSTVYARLQRLEKSNQIEGRADREGNRPERTIYTISEKGRKTLAQEVVRHLTGFNDDPRTLGFAYLDALAPHQVMLELKRHEKHLVSEIEALDQLIANHKRPTLHPEGPFLNCMSRDHLSVELRYVQAAKQILSEPKSHPLLKGFFAINDSLASV